MNKKAPLSQMKKILIILIFLFLLLVTFFLVQFRAQGISINGQEFQIEKVGTPEQMEKGLSGRNSLCQNCGMLFQFPQKGKYSFVMTGMKFNLDIIWIDGNKIVHVAKNIPFDSKEKFRSNTEADKVLELNAGTLDKYNIKEGDLVKF